MNPTPMQRRFKQVDVFTATPYWGNPLAVVLDSAGLEDADMQRLARWTNLSETTFVLPPTHPQADYRVRIFTPGGELPFAGHPTLGTCHAWLQAGGQPKQTGPQAPIVQECQVGLVSLQMRDGRLAFQAPALTRRALSADEGAPVLRALGLDAAQVQATQWLTNGPTFLGVLLDNPATVLALKPDHSALRAMNLKVGVAARRPPAQDGAAHRPDLEVRVFVDPSGVPEDPVTGSFNASLAQWLIADGLMPPRYLAAQGTVLGRAGRVHVTQDPAGQVWVGGDVVTCVDGWLHF